MGRDSTHRRLLSTLPAGRAERRLVLGVVLASAVIFLSAAPFAKLPLAQVPAFLPIYQSALVVNDLITAVLLFGQFGILRSHPLFVLASAYLFSAFMAVAHMLSFPGLFSPTGLLGAGPQTTAWLYFLWHGGFPLLVIIYALLKDGPREASRPQGPVGVAVLGGVAAVLAAATGLTLLATLGHDALPAIMQGDKDGPAKIIVASGTWMLSLLALAVLWRRRPHSVLDLWLMVVMCVWIFDIALASVLNHGRYDLGWYAGRIYGLLAASFVLLVLLLENSVLYARLVEAHAGERRERELVERTSAELMAVNKELEAFSYSVSHDLRAPLRAVDGYARMLEEDCAPHLDAEGRRLLGVVREEASRMGRLIDDLLSFSRLGRQEIKAVNVDMTALAREVADELLRQGPERVSMAVEPLPSVTGDRSLLRQVWINLIGNAVKYSGKRERPVVRIAGTNEKSEAVYRVEDNGAGFDMRYYGKLFGVFQRLHRSEEFPGTGVGLAIVQRVVSRHGGRVWAEGRPGEGATFFFALPGEAGNDGRLR